MKRKILAIVLILILAAFGVNGYSETDRDAIAGKYDHITVGTVTGITGDFFTDMWGSNSSDIDVRTLLHGYSPVHWDNDAATFKVDPSVVTGLSVLQDAEGNRTFAVFISENLYYSDGSRVTAKDYVFSVLLSAAPEMKEIGANTEGSRYILGIDEYCDGTSDYLSGLHVISDEAFSITVKAEYEPFFYESAYLNFNPYPIHIIAPGCEVCDDGEGAYIRNIPTNEVDGREKKFTADLLRTTILDTATGYKTHPSVVSGPYVLKDYDSEHRTADFEINPYYKGNSNGIVPSIEHLSIVPVTNENMISLLETGAVDLVNKVVVADSIAAGMELVDTGEYSMSNYSRTGFSFVGFNCERDTVASVEVRKAITLCMDRDALINKAVRNFGVAVDGYYGIGQWIFQLVDGRISPPVAKPEAGASADELNAYRNEIDKWDSLSVENIVYGFDMEKAEELLVSDGWILNNDATAYDPTRDSVRCKIGPDGNLLALDLTLVVADTSTLVTALTEDFSDHLSEIGIRLEINTVTASELFDIYYHRVERDCDMVLLATNFSAMFDPSFSYAFTEDTEGNRLPGATNYSGIIDEELYRLAKELRLTEPGDVLRYCEKWIEFQKRWSDVLPAIPLYSNVYMDFFTDTLHNYDPDSGLSWSEAIIGAYLGDDVETVTGDMGVPGNE